MAGLYVDTSALGRVLLAEPDAAVIAKTLASYEEQWSSELVMVELGRLGKLHALQADAHQLLANIGLVRITSPRLRSAAAIDPADVRTLDAIHLGAALALHKSATVSAVLTFDAQLQAGCQHHGLALMVAVAAVVLAQKLFPPRPTLDLSLALVIVALGVATAAA